MLNVYLKKSRDKPVKNGHPWIFSGSIDRVEGEGTPGEACRIIAADGAVLGHGYYNKKSAITVRMLTAGDRSFSSAVLGERIARAVLARQPLLASEETDSCRLVNAEGDFLPGLVVDRYGDGLCIQILTAGMERMRADILSALEAVCAPRFVFERSDTESSGREGLTPREGLAIGVLPESIVIRENGVAIPVDTRAGQKTGYFFDQRENRRMARAYAAGRRCLDCFAYSGGFTANLLAGGADSVVAVDNSRMALEWCARTVALCANGPSRTATVRDDAFEYLRSIADPFDLVVLDPPKFAKHPGDVERAARGYKDINLAAMKKIAPGGVLFTFSCSSAIDARLFRQIVFSACADARRSAQILHLLSAGSDHPVNLSHPEGEYLKGIVLRLP